MDPVTMLNESLKETRDSLKDLSKGINTLNNTVVSMNERLKNVESSISEMKPPIEDYKKTKQRGLGYLAGAAIAGSGITFSVAEIISAFLKKGS